MSFRPINVIEEDIIQEQEEHTRELQIEEGYEVFQKALKCQTHDKFDAAFDHYDALFKIDVMSLPAESSPPAVYKLKYLACKNYALLLLTDLKNQIGEMSDEKEIRKELEYVFQHISEALVYDSSEAAFLEHVYLLSDQLGYKREARLALECIVYSESRAVDLEDALSSGDFVTPQEYKSLIGLRKLLESIKDFSTLKNNSMMKAIEGFELSSNFQRDRADYSWLGERLTVRDFVTRMVEDIQSKKEEVTITSKDWLAVLTSLNDKAMSLTKLKRNKAQYDDAYNYSESPAIVVKFQLPHGLVDVPSIEGNSKTSDASESAASSVTAAQPQQQPPAPEEPKKRRRKSEFDEGRSRSSKRFRPMGEAQSLLNGSSDEEEFLESINKHLELSGVKLEPVQSVFTSGEGIDQKALVDFKNLLMSWDDSQADLFLRNDAVGDNKKRKSQPVMQMLDFAALGDSEMVRQPVKVADKGINEFLHVMRDGSFHLQEARIKVLDYLLMENGDGKCSILTEHWPDALISKTKETIDWCEQILYKRAKENAGEDIKQIQLAQAVCELLVDTRLTLEKSFRSQDRRDKRDKKENEIRLNACNIRLERWLGLCGDLLALYSGPQKAPLELRHEWVSILSIDDPIVSLTNLERFQKQIEDSDVDIEFFNCSTIPRLSAKSVTTQISKFKAASVFAKIFELQDEGAESSDDTSGDEQHQQQWGDGEPYDKVAVLESILMPNEHPSQIEEHGAIAQFLSTATLEFRLQLWYILLDGYVANGQREKSFEGYLRILTSSIEEFSSSAYEASEEQQRTVTLLRSMNVCLDITRKLVDLGMKDDTLFDRLSDDMVKKSYNSVSQLLKVLRVFVLFGDAITDNNVQAPPHASWRKAARLFQELVVRVWSLIYWFHKRSLPASLDEPPRLYDMLAIIHDEIGMRNYCDIGDGFFLDLSLHEINKMESEDKEQDWLQALYCRYGFAVEYDPYDHHATSIDLDKEKSLEYVGSVMNVILSKDNIQKCLQKSDVRAVLVELQDALGKPDENQNSSIAQNKSVLDNYLESSIVDAELLQNALKGRLSLSFFTCHNEYAPIGQSGFYYIQGLTELFQYKNRPKQAVGREDDVQNAIDYFSYDLMCNSNRFESWFGLAECYDAMAELDLSMSAEKINNVDQRNIPVGHCRKSIVACAMAISVYLQKQAQDDDNLRTKSLTKHYKEQVTNMWPMFARILFQATRSPMNMDPFRFNPNKLFFNKDGIMYNQKSRKTMKEVMLWRVADECLKVTLNQSEEEDWKVLYMRFKVLHKLKRYDEAIECLKKTVQKVEQVSKDAALVPVTRLVAITYKYMKKQIITPDQGVDLLRATSFSGNLEDTSPSYAQGMPDTIESVVYLICVHTLQRIKHQDRKNNLHRPTYRLARIFDEVYGKVDRAKEEMLPMYSRGNNAKPLSIWKEEFERPGKHYELTYKYLSYYIDLCHRTRDTEQLAVLIKRLRRSSDNNMARRSDAWDQVTLATAKTVKEINSMSENYSEMRIPVLSSEEFDSVTEKMHKDVESFAFVPKIADWLIFAEDKKKLNNGYGSTMQLDDLFVSVYLKIHEQYLDEHPGLKPSVSEATPPPPVAKTDGTTNSTSPSTMTTQTASQASSQAASHTVPQAAPQVAQSFTPPPPPQPQQKLVAARQRVTRKLIVQKGKELVKILSETSKKGPPPVKPKDEANQTVVVHDKSETPAPSTTAMEADDKIV